MVYGNIGETERFRFRHLAVADVMDGIHHLPPHFLIGLFTPDNGAQVDVHVVFHLLVGAPVGRNF